MVEILSSMGGWCAKGDSSVLVLYALASAAGLWVGCLINLLAYRIPKAMYAEWKEQCIEFLELKDSQRLDELGVKTDRGDCAECDRRFSWRSVVFLKGLLAPRGQCTACGSGAMMRAPFVVILNVILSVFLVDRFGCGAELYVSFLITWVLLLLTLIDLDHQLLPDDIVLPMLWAGILFNALGGFVSLESSIYGAVFGYLSFWVVFHLFKLATGKEGMGYGDFKLLAMLGAWMGWEVLPIIVVGSAVAGLLSNAVLIAFKRVDGSQPVAFGPYLALAGWVSMIWGSGIIKMYVDVSGLAIA